MAERPEPDPQVYPRPRRRRFSAAYKQGFLAKYDRCSEVPMARPMIATKLYVPKLRRGLVTRPRLSERLRRGAESRLTLVSAPAGFGKTTVLAEWLGEPPGDDRSVAWLSLDPADNEPASFWTYEQPEQVPLLHQRASRWYERHALAEDAVRHALAALDFDRAAHLMSWLCRRCDATGRTRCCSAG